MNYESVATWLTANWFQASVIALLVTILLLVWYAAWLAYHIILQVRDIQNEIAAIRYRQHQADWG